MALVLVILLLLVGDLVRRRIPGLDSCYSGITYRNNAPTTFRPFSAGNVIVVKIA